MSGHYQFFTYFFDYISGPTAVVPQYYSVQTPWGIYPAGLIQQGAAAGQQTPQAVTPQVSPYYSIIYEHFYIYWITFPGGLKGFYFWCHQMSPTKFVKCIFFGHGKYLAMMVCFNCNDLTNIVSIDYNMTAELNYSASVHMLNFTGVHSMYFYDISQHFLIYRCRVNCYEVRDVR